MSYGKINSWLKKNIQVIFFSVLLILLFAAIASAREVTLTWDANSEPDLDHYVVYWGANSGDYTYNSENNGDYIGLGTEYSISIPDDGLTYFFAVTAVDISGLESDFSNEVNTDDNPSIIVLPVNSNWNLISISGGAGITSIEEALAPIMNNVISVWAYDNGSWLVYDPANPDFSDLLEVEPGQGMWVNMSNNAELTLPGETPANGLDLTDGWNLVGFSSPASRNINDVLLSIDADVISVWSYQNGQWLIYDPLDPDSSDLTTMNPGYGYWINMNAPAVWTY
jgi:hypothetical protein